MIQMNCVCGYRLEGTDDADLFAHLRAHSDESHPEMDISDAEVHEVLVARRRMTPWDGSTAALMEPVEVRPLDRTRADDFLRFFDQDAFMDNPMWAGCYCMFPELALDDEAWSKRGFEENRAEKTARVRRGDAQGYMAYAGDKVVGWCNAGPRSAYPGITTRPKFTDGMPDDGIGAIVCFVVAAPYRHQGVARKLLAAACEGLREVGLAIVEAYPPHETGSDARAHFGPLQMYLDAGFAVHRQTERGPVVRKQLA